MSLAERASPPLSDGTPQGAEDARAGYLERMEAPPSGSPVLYAGDYGGFSSPGAGSPLRGEAVSYLASWASRLSAAAGTAALSADASLPQPVWESASGIAFMRGAFPPVSAGSPSLDVFRLRLLDFLRLRRAPVGVPCDQAPSLPRSWTASWAWWTSASGNDANFVPRPSGPSIDPAPSFSEACSLAGSQGAVDANGGKWLVPLGDGAAGMPFGAGPGGGRPSGDTDLMRFALAYMASLSAPQADASLRGGGFASRYAVPPRVRDASGDLVPDPSFVQEPEPPRASDVRALFEDTLRSGRSRVWAGCPGLNLFADLGDVKTVPAVTETRWVYSGKVSYSWADRNGDYPDVSTGELDLEPYDFGAEDPSAAARAAFFAHDGAGNRVALAYSYDAGAGRSTWTAYYRPSGSPSDTHPAMTASYPGATLDRLDAGTCAPVGSDPSRTPGSCRCAFSIERTPYEHEVSPARTYREWGSTALPGGASFEFRSVARLEPTDPDVWYEGHPPTDEPSKRAWFKASVFDLDAPDVYEYSTGVGGTRGSLSWGYPDDADYGSVWWAVTGGDPPPDPYTGRVEWANSVGKVRDLPYPDDIASLAGAGIPEGWSLGSDDMWVVGSSGGDWGECYAGVNWAVHAVGTPSFERAASSVPSGGDGRYDLEYVAKAPAAAGVASPLCPGGVVAVPVQSADSVAVRPLFCATVTVKTESVRCHSYTQSTWSADGAYYDRLIRFAATDTEVETRYVVGFAPVPCRWARDAGEASADATERHPLGAAGPDGLWAFVASKVLGPLGLSDASSLVDGASATYETYVAAAMGASGPDSPVAVPHDSAGAAWITSEVDEHGNQQFVNHDNLLQAVGGWARVGDSVEYAEVSGTVEFPLCVFESGYCA